MKEKFILIGCEESQAVTIAMRKEGIKAYSCDLKDCSGGHPQWHLKMDVFQAIKGGLLHTQNNNEIKIDQWQGAIFFPDCTYLTCSAEWAYKDGPYHQKIRQGVLTGNKRRQARAKAFEFFMALWNCGIEKIAIENPIGVMSTYFRKPDQIIQPYEFGDDASKSTCLWLKNLPNLQPTKYFPPRIVNGKKRWGNQTDGGQYNLSPTADRAMLRAKTYPGVAKAMALQWAAKF